MGGGGSDGGSPELERNNGSVGMTGEVGRRLWLEWDVLLRLLVLDAWTLFNFRFDLDFEETGDKDNSSRSESEVSSMTSMIVGVLCFA